jgi:hypothetical protein
MAKEREAGSDLPSAAEMVVPHDVVNEQVIIAAVIVDWHGETAKLLDRYSADTFLAEEHRAGWTALQELHRRKLGYDAATLKRYAGPKCDPGYLEKLVELRPEPPENLGHHLDGLLWDRQRASAVTGPIASLMEALKNYNEEPERVRALARHVADAFQGGAGRGRFLAVGEEVVRAQMAEVRKRIAGHATYTYGIKGLDFDLETGERRVLPGPAPGQVTVFTAVSGSGKTTAAGRVTLGIAKQRRKVLYGAYEMGPGMTLELLACMSLGWSRSRLMKGQTQDPERGNETMGAREQIALEERMNAIHPWVRFMRNAFRIKGGQKASNQRNLDIIQEHIADSGCEVFVADLWKRALVDTRPEAEEDALYQQQTMAEETRTHHILLQQQRLKDVETRPDKRPTREGVKGSAAWVEIADTMVGWHLPAMWKAIENNKVEAIILKQRYGVAPLAVEFDWSGEHGSITGGVSVEYKHAGGDAGGGLFDGEFKAPKLGGSGDRRKK